MSEVELTNEERLERMYKKKGVEMVIVTNMQGQVVWKSPETEEINSKNKTITDENKLASLVTNLGNIATNMIRELDIDERVSCVRVRTSEREFMLATDPEEGNYGLVVVQDLNAAANVDNVC